MTPIRYRLTGWVLSLYVSRQVSRTCDDLDWPDWFPTDERELLVREMERENSGDPVTIEESVRMYATGDTAPPAWWLADFLSTAIEKEQS